MSDNFLFHDHALDSISFSMFSLHGAKAKDKTPRFGTYTTPNATKNVTGRKIGLVLLSIPFFSIGSHKQIEVIYGFLLENFVFVKSVAPIMSLT